MTLQEAYTYLMADSFMAMLILPLQSNFVFLVMKLFGSYNPLIMVPVAAIGTSLAACANWGLGKAIAASLKFHPNEDKTINLINLINKYEVVVLALTFIPFIGSFITTGLGVIGGRFKWIIPTVFLVHILYFSFIINT